ncbi:hypothetical protein [Pedobacter flavus]|uniref:Uncharacterized protein n=1 Tax=Pedobacter flavus TaxID=3113906 RepID=A0ABU7H1G1_9SPHI|nr:hypothetical protein [Pedobacter sp. VNH31]MEE1885169.1 hypothetical protein [Pedobacter sp. VNH31]
MDNQEHKDWEIEFDFLAKMPKNNSFVTPDNFFKDSAEQIITQQTILNYHSNPMDAFKTPAGFFNSQKENIERKIEMLESPLNVGGFKVPSNYFDELSSTLINKVENTKPSKNKLLRIWTSDFMKYAAAACFILITATALLYDNKEYEVINTKQSAAYFSDNDLYYIDEQMIIDHIDLSSSEDLSNNLSSADAENYILNNYSTSELIEEYH